MTRRDLADLLLLAALWGGSFLFMRVAAPHFGALPLAAVRVAGAALLLVAILAAQRGFAGLRGHWRPISWVGISNSALPFLGFSIAALSIPAGLSSILNATSPMFGALIAMLWLRETGSPSRTLGLILGFAGVAMLAWDNARVDSPSQGSATAIGLCLGASALYGYSACFVRRHLATADPLAVACGSQISAALALALPALLLWPAATPPTPAWLAAAALALPCTGLAYVLYFRLIARIGPARAITVTFLIPAFAMLWASLFLGEIISLGMLGTACVILLGTGLATGLLRLPVARMR